MVEAPYDTWGYDLGSAVRRNNKPVEVPPVVRVYMLRIKGTGAYYGRRNTQWVTIKNAAVWTTPAGAISSKGHARPPAGSELEIAEFEINELGSW